MTIVKSERMVKWSKEAQGFWEESADGSVVLQCVISYGCVSQTDEGFEDLVNTLNSLPFKDKIKKLYITDTSYLYRHCIHEFSAYCEKDVPTIWYLNNKAEIEKLEIETELVSWADGLKHKKFKEWYERILKDFGGDSNGNGIVRDFRDLTFVDASLSAYKGNYELPCCIDFMLEECAYACAFLQDSNLLYPMELAHCIKNAFGRYGINSKFLNYKTSKYAQKHTSYRDNRFDMLDKEIAIFMKEKVSNVNFFVIDKFGNHVYKNYALEKIIGDRNVKELTEQAWSNNQEVIRTGKTIVVEEQYNDATYLSVKSPLIIDGEVEGVMGLAVDITDRKKLEILERKKQSLAESVAHDIRSPLMVLSILANDAFLPEKKHTVLKNVISSIERILGKLLSKYNNNGETKADKEESICIQVALVESLRLMRYQYSDANIEFDYVPEASNNCFFIKGDYSDFCRMMFNLMNNAVEALRKNAYGVVKIGFTADNENSNISVYVKDNGRGMPVEIVEKINDGALIQTTKNRGHGLGMKQIMKTVNDMNGRLEVDSTENVGTEFYMTFSKSNAPSWFSDTIYLKKDDVVIVLDDDPSIFEAWKDIFEPFLKNISVKYFTNGREVLSFISSCCNEAKDKLFLIADYELRGQEFDGIEVIEHAGMQGKTLLVTSSHTSEIKFFNEKCSAFKMFPKLCGLDKIKVIVEDVN